MYNLNRGYIIKKELMKGLKIHKRGGEKKCEDCLSKTQELLLLCH
jgi:hypothetical protein